MARVSVWLAIALWPHSWYFWWWACYCVGGFVVLVVLVLVDRALRGVREGS